MKTGVATSLFAHGGIFVLAFVSLGSPKPLNVSDVEALPIDIIPIEEITKAVEGSKTAPRAPVPAPKKTTKAPQQETANSVGDTDKDIKAEAPEETKQPPVEKVEAPAPKPRPTVEKKPTPVPVPKLAPKPEPKKDIALLLKETQPIDEPAPEKPAEEAFQKLPQKVATPKIRPSTPKPQTPETNKRKVEKKVAEKTSPDSQKTKKTENTKKALLNKVDSSAGGAKRSERKAALGTKNGREVTLAQSDLDALRAQIIDCWNYGALAGHIDSRKLRARAVFTVNRQGILEGKPKVEASGSDARTNRTMAGGVRRAILSCKEFPMLANKYDVGEEIGVNFSLPET